MNLDEAYKVLELPNGTSVEEAKKKARKLMSKNHPYINKEPDAESKFKEINLAIQTIEKPPQQQFPQNGGINIQDLINRKRRKNINAVPVNLTANLSFKDSIFGCKRDFTYERNIKCEDCSGQGMYTIHNGCAQCGGRGIIIQQHGSVIMQQTCPKCHGRMNHEECKPCGGTGSVKSNRTINVSVPGGVENGTTLRLEGMGHFVDVVNDFFGSGDMYTDAFVKLHVSPAEFKCSIKNNNLHTLLNISLLEALQGCKKKIQTLEGEKEITIKEKTKNAEQVIIPNLGVARTGNQIIDINVEYPQDIDSLISHLSK